MRASLVLIAGCALSFAAQAQYNLDWHTFEGGGALSSGGPYTLQGSIGQHDAEVVSLCSADGGAGCVQPSYELTGGFWAGLLPKATCGADLACIFRDGFEQQPGA